ncbi:MAG: hypothetical protein K9W44_16095 [Candidatus Lokiarchaeota archaeon]|nr:hypothetical protein [Candidatus Harpocratesius repetitus]
MPSELLSKTDEILHASREKLAKQIRELSLKAKNIEKKEDRFVKFLEEKESEIQDAKQKINELVEIESKSKIQISQHVEMLTWLVDSIDESVSDLKNRMLEHSQTAISENLHDFNDYLRDLKDIIAPLNQCKKIKDENLLKQTIFSITETLTLFSTNINDSIYSMAEVIHKAAVDAIDVSSKEFDDFVADIYQIFDTFNSILQKLKLTNSIRKYLELEEIYDESLKLLDDYQKLLEVKNQFLIQKGIKEIQLEELNQFGFDRNLNKLKLKKDFFKKKIQLQSNQFAKLQEDYNELLEEKEIVELEKSNIHEFFKAISDEILISQKYSAETYNLLYSTLDEIHSSIPFIKVDLRNSTENAINTFIDEFINRFQKFGKIVSIITKVNKLSDLEKKQKNLGLIYQKSQKYLKTLQHTIKSLTKTVAAENTMAIESSFKTFLKFIENFKENFFIIQDSVAQLTLSMSNQLIADLLKYSDEQLEFIQSSAKMKQKLEFQQEIIAFLSQNLQSIENDLKIRSQVDNRNRRKILFMQCSTQYKPTSFEIIYNWSLKNSGIVPFSAINFYDIISSNFSIQSSSPEINVNSVADSFYLANWDVYNLEKQKDTKIIYSVLGYNTPNYLDFQNMKNITSFSNFRYKKLAIPIQLNIYYCGSTKQLIIEILNPSSSNCLWNLILILSITGKNKDELIIKIPYLSAGQKYIHSPLSYKKESIKPVFFYASTHIEYGIKLERSLTSLDEYIIEPFIRNTSDFLIHMGKIIIYSAKSPNKEIIRIPKKTLEKIPPKLDFQKRFTIKTLEDPPEIFMEIVVFPHLVYKIEEISQNDFLKLNPTPQLLLSSDFFEKAKSIKIIPSNEKEKFDELIHPELLIINEEIKRLENKKLEYERYLKEIQLNIQEKMEEKAAIIAKIEQEQKIQEKIKESYYNQTKILKKSLEKKTSKKETVEIITTNKKLTAKKTTTKKATAKKTTTKKTTAKKTTTKKRTTKKSTAKKRTTKKSTKAIQKKIKKKSSKKKVDSKRKSDESAEKEKVKRSINKSKKTIRKSKRK